MLFFAIPFSAAFGAILFSTFYFQKKLSSKVEDVKIAAFSAKLQKISSEHLLRIYKIAAVVGLPVSGVLALIPMLGPGAGLGFFLGIICALLILHASFLFLIKLDAQFIDRSSYGLIQSFNLVFGGGNMIGFFLLSSALFVVAVYHVSLGPSSIGLVSLGLGVSFVATLFKLYQSVFLEKDLKKNDAPNLPDKLARLHILKSVVRLADIFETFFLALVVAILGASLLFPGLAGAVALPLLVGIAGIISAALSTKLIHIGATTNITKNILFSFLGSIVVSTVVAFPLIAWAMNENVQYSNIVLWLSITTGLSMLFFTFASHYNNLLRKLFNMFYPSIIALFFAVSFGVSYFLAGPYGLILLIISALSLGGVIVSLKVLRSVAWSAQFIAKDVDLPEERGRITRKLSRIADNMSRDINVYMLLVTLLLISGLFVIYQQEAEHALVQFSLSLDNPHVFAGIFIGVAYAFLFVKFLGQLSKERILIKTADINERNRKTFMEKVLFDAESASAAKILAKALVFVYVAPLALVWLFSAELFSGFFYGAVITAAVFCIAASMREYGDKAQFDIESSNPYSGNVGVILLRILKTVGIASLLTVIFII